MKNMILSVLVILLLTLLFVWFASERWQTERRPEIDLIQH